MTSNHKHKVNDTKLRSVLKTFSSRIIEVAVDTFLIGSVYTFFHVPHAYELATGMAVAIEVLCALTNYLNDRLWNQIQWGREVEDIEKEDTNKVEHL